MRPTMHGRPSKAEDEHEERCRSRGLYYILRQKVDFVTRSGVNLSNITLGEVVLGGSLGNSEGNRGCGLAKSVTRTLGIRGETIEVGEDGLFARGEGGEGTVEAVRLLFGK